MLDAASAAIEAGTRLQRSDLDDDLVAAMGFVKLMEIVGEAASGMTVEVRSGHPEFPWAKVVGMRHRLVHAYYDINLDVVWDTLSEDLPVRVAGIRRILKLVSRPD
jgi:uncharacterized protein with HEPN domain